MAGNTSLRSSCLAVRVASHVDYYDLAPFTFNGAIGKTQITYTKE